MRYFLSNSQFLGTNPCDFEPCTFFNNSVCFDLTENGTLFGEDDWIGILEAEYNVTDWDEERLGEGYYCYGDGDDCLDCDDNDNGTFNGNLKINIFQRNISTKQNFKIYILCPCDFLLYIN